MAVFSWCSHVRIFFCHDPCWSQACNSRQKESLARYLTFTHTYYTHQVDPLCLSEVTSRLKRVTARTGQYIITAGEEGKNMYFIGSTPQNTIGSGLKLGEELARGIVQNKCLRVVVDGVEVTLLGTGDYFGEVS